MPTKLKTIKNNNQTQIELPNKITPCPILQASVSIHFESNYDSQMSDIFAGILFDALYENLKKSYPDFERLSTIQLPEEIGSNNEDIFFEPNYRISNNNYVIEIGSKIFSIIALKEYIGWKNYFQEIKKVINILIKLKRINKIMQINVRYIDFFQNINILDKIKLNLSFNSDTSDEIMKSLNNTEDLTIRKEIQHKNNTYTVQINNNVNIENGSEELTGSIFDIECYTNKPISDIDGKNIFTIIDEMHLTQKKIFYSLITEDFLKQFKVE